VSAELSAEMSLPVELPPLPGTPAAKLASLREPLQVSREFFQNAVNAAWQLSLRGETVSTVGVQELAPDFFTPELTERLQFVLKSERFQRALEERGISADVRSDLLSPEMAAAIRAFLEPSGLALRSRLKRAGVSWEQFQGFQRFGPFRDALRQASESGLKSAVELANAKLVENIDAGDLKSMQYVHELTGYFTPGKQQSLDAMQLVSEVMTVVLRKVKDPALLMELAGEFRMLQERASMSLSVGASGEGPALAGLAHGETLVPLDGEMETLDPESG